MSEFSCFSSKDLTLIATIIAIQLAEGRDANDINILGNLVSAVGSLLSVIAAQEQTLIELSEDNNSNNNSKQSSK